MAGLQIVFVLSCVIFGSASGQGDSGYLCVMNCTFRHANAWASILSLNNPSARLMNFVQGITPTLPPGVSATNDSLTKVCDVYDSYNYCLEQCPDDWFRTNVKSTINGIQMICTSQRKEVSSNTMPCVNQFSTFVQGQCRQQNEELMSTTNQLQQLDRKTPAVNFVGLLQRLCESAVAQSRCVIPALGEKCGSSATGLLQQLMSASLGSVEKIIGDKRDMMPVQCKELFDIIVKHDNGSISFVWPSTTTTTTTAATGTSQQNAVAERSLNSDLLNGTSQNQDISSGVGSTFSSFSATLFVILFIFMCI
jgi:hypothetical protein